MTVRRRHSNPYKRAKSADYPRKAKKRIRNKKDGGGGEAEKEAEAGGEADTRRPTEAEL